MRLGLEKLSLYPHLRRYLRTYPEWRLTPPQVRLSRSLARIGSEYGGYAVDTALITSESVVYSLGIGQDISFDLALIQRYGVNVYAFDPTPRVKTWLASQMVPGEFHFHDVGIADFDGQALLYVPRKSEFISHSIIPARQFSKDAIRLPVVRLRTAMRLLGHERIDILKIDIEGEEYAVIEDLVREKIPVQQILIEFHHRFSSVGTSMTRRALATLERYGLQIAYICPRTEVFTLLRVE